MRTIVFPTDFSDAADQALPVAAQLARQYEATLYIVHVLALLPLSYAPVMFPSNEPYRLALAEIEKRFSELRTRPVVQHLDVQTPILSGSSPVVLFEDDRFANADLLVIASTGASGLKETLLGSNAEHLIRRTTMPVLVLKNPPGHLSVKSVVFASDFTDPYDTSIELVQTLLDGFGQPHIHLVYVHTANQFVPSHVIKPRMDAFAARYMPGGCSLHQWTDVDVETGLRNFAKEKQADLIILGTHEHRGLRHFLQGSIAEDVANSAAIPVLVLPLHQERASHRLARLNIPIS